MSNKSNIVGAKAHFFKERSCTLLLKTCHVRYFYIDNLFSCRAWTYENNNLSISGYNSAGFRFGINNKSLFNRFTWNSCKFIINQTLVRKGFFCLFFIKIIDIRNIDIIHRSRYNKFNLRTWNNFSACFGWLLHNNTRLYFICFLLLKYKFIVIFIRTD